ncbi:hypothetical protein ACHAW5_008114 [Stephanodiscus triporus]|uniref:AAA+ ATPase domain-containing protein n=1 Tax=Stephanodiscus triporus TaxID=2934178 RepID=A0ABD3P9U7_9STRA
MPTRFPQLFTGKQRRSRDIAVRPSRTGKSYLAKAVATEADSTFFSVSSADLISKWQGESERLVRNLFEMARESPGSRAIIFIDEVDSLCGSRSEGRVTPRVESRRNFWFKWMEWMRPFVARFEKRVYIPLPEHEARSAMVKIHLGDTPNNLSEHDFDTLGKEAEGASGSDIKVLVKEALMEPLRRCQQA